MSEAVSEKEAEALWDIERVAAFLQCSVRHARDLDIPRSRHGKKYVYDPADVKVYNSKAKKKCPSANGPIRPIITRTSPSEAIGFFEALALVQEEKRRPLRDGSKRKSVRKSGAREQEKTLVQSP